MAIKQRRIPIKLPRKELLRRLNSKRLELQRQLHTYMDEGEDNSKGFWYTHDRMEKIRTRIYLISTRRK